VAEVREKVCNTPAFSRNPPGVPARRLQRECALR
jgi:hypothetical protein